MIIKTNKIVYPFLGVRYVLVDESVKKKYKLSVDYGAFVIRGDGGEKAITKDSAADKAGIKERDVILTINGEFGSPKKFWLSNSPLLNAVVEKSLMNVLKPSSIHAYFLSLLPTIMGNQV